jgi:hypothetical protein
MKGSGYSEPSNLNKFESYWKYKGHLMLIFKLNQIADTSFLTKQLLNPSTFCYFIPIRPGKPYQIYKIDCNDKDELKYPTLSTYMGNNPDQAVTQIFILDRLILTKDIPEDLTPTTNDTYFVQSERDYWLESTQVIYRVLQHNLTDKYMLCTTSEDKENYNYKNVVKIDTETMKEKKWTKFKDGIKSLFGINRKRG